MAGTVRPQASCRWDIWQEFAQAMPFFSSWGRLSTKILRPDAHEGEFPRPENDFRLQIGRLCREVSSCGLKSTLVRVRIKHFVRIDPRRESSRDGADLLLPFAVVAFQFTIQRGSLNP